MSFKEIEPTEDLVSKEHRILSFWVKNKIFDKLIQKNKDKAKWSFLDGPITANNPMGVHHAWGRTYKDLFQRYKAMQGFEERFQNGFDCQGLWVEVEVEKDLGFKTKKDIERFGIEKFVEKCKERVLKYSKIQTEQSIRLGQWMDWNKSYYTMSDENNYAIWHFLKKCHEKGYLYKGRDSVPWCPRCGTAISQHEILTEEYKEIEHPAIYFKLPIIDEKYQNTSFLVWTTTPWTIPANVALAVHPEFEYGIYEKENHKLILLKELASKILGTEYKFVNKIKGKDLIGLKYLGPFDNLERVKKSQKENIHTFHSIVPAKDLVTAEEGTGIIHIAPGAGTEDFRLGQKENLPVIEVIDEAGVYLNDLGKFSGKNAKEQPGLILDELENLDDKKYFFKIEKYTHRYPTCWRCKTELVWRVVDEWYIRMDELRGKMIEVTKKIKWLPSFGLDRELDWLKNMQDWLISKKRYWGLALPIYECKKCGSFEVIGSKEELKKRAVEGWENFANKSPHRPWIDEIKIKCSKCDEIVSRIPDVGNPWLDAGIVPFSTLKYFEDKNYWQAWFPAKFICESFPGQFKNWFYSLIAMSTVLENTNPFEIVLGYALVRDEKGEEMHKSKGNAIWFDDAAEKMSVDVMRWMFVSANPYENLNFGYGPAEEIKRRFILIFKNVCQFFITYANIDGWTPQKNKKSEEELDKWILSRINRLISDVTGRMDEYDVFVSARRIQKVIVDDLSTWYLRRTRKRRDDEFYSTLYFVLMNLIKMMAPFMPFISESLYQKLRTNNDPESVHLCEWPKANEETLQEDLTRIKEMDRTRDLAEVAHAQRAEKKIKIRQPLAKAIIKIDLKPAHQEILKEEINVKEIIIDKNIKDEIELDTKLTPALQEEGNLREIIRQIQDLRKKADLLPSQKIDLYFDTSQKIKSIFDKNSKIIKNKTSLNNIKAGKLTVEIESTSQIDGQSLWLGVKK